MLSVLVSCGLRRAELSALTVEDLQIRQGHWAIVDRVGKGGHVRTVPMPAWVKDVLDRWRESAKVTAGRIFRAVSRHGTPWGKEISENLIWYVVRRVAERIQLDHLAPHDLRRTCAKLCHVNGGELEQIQFLLGHVSVLTTERYLGCKQNLAKPVNDRFGSLFASRKVEMASYDEASYDTNIRYCRRSGPYGNLYRRRTEAERKQRSKKRRRAGDKTIG